MDEKRRGDGKRVVGVLFFVAGTLGLCALPIVLSGGNAMVAFGALARGAAGGPSQFEESLARAIRL
jgi:hypothetical protein